VTLTYAMRFGALQLNAATGYVVEEIADQLLYRTEWQSRLGGDTGLFIRDQYEGRRITITGTILGVDTEQVRTRADALLHALSLGVAELRVFTQTTPQDVRSILCLLERDPEFEWVAGSQLRAMRFSVRLRSRFATWKGATGIFDSFFVTASPSIKLLAFNPGTAPAFPVVGLHNGMSSVNLTGVTISLGLLGAAGKALVVRGLDLAAGAVLFLDFAEGRIGDGTIKAPRPASVEGEWWSLPPLVASTLQVVTDAPLTSPEGLQVNVLYRPEFWSH
jgi:hypothetical protein